jgi:hypothetical protein
MNSSFDLHVSANLDCHHAVYAGISAADLQLCVTILQTQAPLEGISTQEEEQ